MSRFIWPVAVMAAAVALAGCGADSSSEDGAAQVSAEDWRPEFEGNELQPLPNGFPDRRLTILNSDEPGSSDGLYARVMQKALQEVSPQPVQVVDRPQQEWGRWTNLESVRRDRRAREGYTSLVISFQGVALDVLTSPITPELGLTLDDMNPVIATEQAPFVLIVPADAPWSTYEEFLADARADSGLRYASLGVGSQLDVAMERLMAEGGFEADKVPLKDPVQITTTVAAGEADFAMMLPDVALGQYEAGRIKVLLAVGDEAPEPWTDVTTTADLGLDEPWGSVRGVMVAPETPELHRRWLFELFEAASETEAYQQRIAKLPGASAVSLDGDEVREVASRAVELAEPLIRDLGLHHTQQ